MDDLRPGSAEVVSIEGGGADITDKEAQEILRRLESAGMLSREIISGAVNQIRRDFGAVVVEAGTGESTPAVVERLEDGLLTNENPRLVARVKRLKLEYDKMLKKHCWNKENPLNSFSARDAGKRLNEKDEALMHKLCNLYDNFRSEEIRLSVNAGFYVPKLKIVSPELSLLLQYTPDFEDNYSAYAIIDGKETETLFRDFLGEIEKVIRTFPRTIIDRHLRVESPQAFSDIVSWIKGIMQFLV